MISKGWLATLAGTGLNPAHGILYTSSIFSRQFTETLINLRGGFSC